MSSSDESRKQYLNEYENEICYRERKVDGRILEPIHLYEQLSHGQDNRLCKHIEKSGKSSFSVGKPTHYGSDKHGEGQDLDEYQHKINQNVNRLGQSIDLLI